MRPPVPWRLCSMMNASIGMLSATQRVDSHDDALPPYRYLSQPADAPLNSCPERAHLSSKETHIFDSVQGCAVALNPRLSRIPDTGATQQRSSTNVPTRCDTDGTQDRLAARAGDTVLRYTLHRERAVAPPVRPLHVGFHIRSPPRTYRIATHAAGKIAQPIVRSRRRIAVPRERVASVSPDELLRGY
jgi:hypothetical protein